MATTVTIGGVSAPLGRDHVPRRLHSPVGGVDTYTFEARVGALPATYPGMHQEVVVTVNGTVRFRGDIERCSAPFRSGLGWVRIYTCFGLRARGDWVGHQDSNTGSDSSTYNGSPDIDFVEYMPSRAGKEVGEILLDVLTMDDNAAALDALGIGAYTTLTPPTLPAATLADLAALDRVLPGPLRFGGEKLLTAVDQFLSLVAPNCRMTVDPADGALRFWDMLGPTPVSLTLGVDPVSPPEMSRDVSDCFTAVVVKGRPVATPYAFSLSNGTLDESHFPYDALDVAGAKAAFDPSHFYSPQCVDQGSCVMNTTTTLTVTSDDPTAFWAADFWNHTAGNRYGLASLTYLAGGTITMMKSFQVVDCAALTAGGSALLTLGEPAGHLDFDRYSIRGRRGGRENVYTVYGLPAWAGPKVAPLASRPFPFRYASGAGMQQTSTAMGVVMWSASGTPSYTEISTPVEVDAELGAVVFTKPTFMMAADREPADVVAYVPIYTDENTVRVPSSGYEGGAYTADGVEKVLTVHVPTWRDPANLAGMAAFAQDLLDSVKGPIIEGTVVYHGLDDDLLDAGIALDIDSADFTTPWAGVELPVTGCQLEWLTSPGEATLWRTTLGVSTRRAAFTSAAYMSPDRTGVTMDFGGATLDLSGVGSGLPSAAAIIAGAMNAYGDTLAANGAVAREALANSPGVGKGDGKVDPGKATGPGVSIGRWSQAEQVRWDQGQAKVAGRDRASAERLAAGDQKMAAKDEAAARRLAENQAGQKQGAERGFGSAPGEERERQAARAEEARAARAVQEEQVREASAERDRRKKAGEEYRRRNRRGNVGGFESGDADGGLA